MGSGALVRLADHAAILACFAFHLAATGANVENVERLTVLVDEHDQTLSSCGHPQDAVGGIGC